MNVRKFLWLLTTAKIVEWGSHSQKSGFFARSVWTLARMQGEVGGDQEPPGDTWKYPIPTKKILTEIVYLLPLKKVRDHNIAIFLFSQQYKILLRIILPYCLKGRDIYWKYALSGLLGKSIIVWKGIKVLCPGWLAWGIKYSMRGSEKLSPDWPKEFNIFWRCEKFFCPGWLEE